MAKAAFAIQQGALPAGEIDLRPERWYLGPLTAQNHSNINHTQHQSHMTIMEIL